LKSWRWGAGGCWVCHVAPRGLLLILDWKQFPTFFKKFQIMPIGFVMRNIDGAVQHF
jgi:hypothetical protein